MKTIARAELMDNFRNAESMLIAERDFQQLNRSRTMRLATRPARPARPTAPKVASPAPLHKLWIGAAKTGLLEKVMFAVLVTGAAVGLSFAFSNLLDLVQNWALFHAGIQTLVQ
jgi:hypothetical protein